ncbi:glycoside hydrolase family 71 protein [Xylariaceae sp. FL1272]|nr:glycoside hydrolase family 71 protein [Xylariaceae sp. FL1272]
MSRLLKSVVPLLVASSGLLSRVVEGKAVFAHYLVGGISPLTDHAKQDIDQAFAMGFDAFALNQLDPTADWAINATTQLFDYADSRGDFKLFFSFDLGAHNNFDDHVVLYNQFKDRSSYYHYGDPSRPMVSSFSGGSLGASTWEDFKNTYNVYLVPNVESDGNYYSAPETFFNDWNAAIDGVFSWETNWPGTQETPANVSSSQDESVKLAGDAVSKSYIMGLSTLQFKSCCGGDWYRVGETNLPERMNQILQLAPEFTEVITWNDAGESHYISNCWPETLIEEEFAYGNSTENPHDGWQPLISSFIAAFKAGASDTSAMVPPSGSPFVGAMWYRSILKSCANNGGSAPPGAGAAIDAVDYAVVLPEGSEGYQIRVTSGGQVLRTDDVSAGLSYNSIAGMVVGSQLLELLDGSGNVVASATSKKEVTDQPTNGFCNFNYYVDSLE